jgi:hypothetical protein
MNSLRTDKKAAITPETCGRHACAVVLHVVNPRRFVRLVAGFLGDLVGDLARASPLRTTDLLARRDQVGWRAVPGGSFEEKETPYVCGISVRRTGGDRDFGIGLIVDRLALPGATVTSRPLVEPVSVLLA